MTEWLLSQFGWETDARRGRVFLLLVVGGFVFSVLWLILEPLGFTSFLGSTYSPEVAVTTLTFIAIAFYAFVSLDNLEESQALRIQRQEEAEEERSERVTAFTIQLSMLVFELGTVRGHLAATQNLVDTIRENIDGEEIEDTAREIYETAGARFDSLDNELARLRSELRDCARRLRLLNQRTTSIYTHINVANIELTYAQMRIDGFHSQFSSTSVATTNLDGVAESLEETDHSLEKAYLRLGLAILEVPEDHRPGWGYLAQVMRDTYRGETEEFEELLDEFEDADPGG